MVDNNSHQSHFTPVNDSYPTCERVAVGLLIYPGNITHEFISETLDLKPTESQNIGDLIVSMSGRARNANKTMWYMSSESRVESLDIRRHLDWLLALLSARSDCLLKLQQIDGVQMTVSCCWWSKNASGGPTFWPEQMMSLAKLNLELTLDVQFYGD